MWVTGPRAGVKQCVPKKGCSWVLAIKWGPGSQKGIRGSEFLFSAPDLSLPRAQDQRAGPPPGEEREGPQPQGQGPSTGLGRGVSASESAAAWPWAGWTLLLQGPRRVDGGGGP